MKTVKKQTLSIIIPCFNEEANIKIITDKIIRQIVREYKYEIIFIDDGSFDNSLYFIKQLAENNSNISYISFSRNFGHQIALKAGLDYAKGDCVISMDADLQHPPSLLNKLINKWMDGFEIVYTVRKNINTTFFKKTTSKVFYSVLNFFSDYKVEYGAADFRLLDRKVVDIIKSLEENDLFLRGAISWVGFKKISIPYIPNRRLFGSSKYSLRKMVNLALSGITGFSVKPLRISTYSGYIISTTSFLYGFYAILTSIISSKNISGWTSLLVTVTFLGGIQMIMIGILGEYLGKLFINEKRRPNYIIKEKSRTL